MRLFHLDDSALKNVRPAVSKKKAEHKFYNGPKPFKPHPCTVSRETVMTIRKMRDWSGYTAARIAALTGQSAAYVSAVCTYSTRPDIDPGKRPRPDSKEANEWAAQLAAIRERVTEPAQ